MAEIAIIGGSGLTSLSGLEIIKREIVHTPYGEASGAVTRGVFAGKEIVFLPRHGYGHTIPPHRINYRANIWTLKELGIKKVIAAAAVGGIRADMGPTQIIIPDQIIDYTWSRVTTFFEEGLADVVHIDFTHPYCEALRQTLLTAATNAKMDVVDSGTYGATQGPRLETAAEIRRLQQDGCDMVGMTVMPEAALAREMDLCYATCAVSANWAAGVTDQDISMKEIEKNLELGIAKVRTLLEHALAIV